MTTQNGVGSKLRWTSRFEKLRAEGLTDLQLIAVFHMLSEARVFKYARLERSAGSQLRSMLDSEVKDKLEVVGW